MADFKAVFKCELCGNIVEVIHAGGGTLACCGQDMTRMEEKTADSSKEKHVPLIERTDKGYKVTVGSTPHPMTAEHYIEWIELTVDGKKSQKVFLKPGDLPEAHFQICEKCFDKPVTAREYCNVHGLWKS